LILRKVHLGENIQMIPLAQELRTTILPSMHMSMVSEGQGEVEDPNEPLNQEIILNKIKPPHLAIRTSHHKTTQLRSPLPLILPRQPRLE